MSAAPTKSRGLSEKSLANLRPFKPGQSGNPQGRPKGAARVAREVCGGTPAGLARVLASIADDEKARPQDRIMAARELWDRGWGKAAAFAAIEGADPLELDEVAAEIHAIADALRAKNAA